MKPRSAKKIVYQGHKGGTTYDVLVLQFCISSKQALCVDGEGRYFTCGIDELTEQNVEMEQ